MKKNKTPFEKDKVINNFLKNLTKSKNDDIFYHFHFILMLLLEYLTIYKFL